MNNYLQRLEREQLNLIILKENQTLFTSRKEGMQPLLEAIHTFSQRLLADSIVVDKIVGKAAALLISYFKAKEIHCGVLSRTARAVLDTQGIEYFYQQMLPVIMNKTGTDICPFEQIVLDIMDPECGYKRLLAKLKSLRNV